jgi:hypothetical protein
MSIALENPGTERIRIDRESAANHDLILWLDEPGRTGGCLYIGKYLFLDGGCFEPEMDEGFLQGEEEC